MKVLFLDIDGVLNNQFSRSQGIDIMPEKIIMIKNVCDQTGARVVISSSWRILYDVTFFRNLLRRTGLKGVTIQGMTPTPSKGFRGDDIDAWLSLNGGYGNYPGQVRKYAIVDDGSDMHPHQKEFLVKTDDRMGLEINHVFLLVDILKDK